MELNIFKLNVLELTGNPLCLGSAIGDEILIKMRQLVPSSTHLIDVSFKGVKIVDACCIRNSLASFAVLNAGKLGVLVSDVENEDVLENLRYGFKAKNWPVFVKCDDGAASVYMNDVTFHQPSFVRCYLRRGIQSTVLALDLGISIPNASAKLKKLSQLGFVHRFEESAVSGGKEFTYKSYFASKITFHE